MNRIENGPAKNMEAENKRAIAAAMERLCMENKGMDILDAAKITIRNRPELFRNLNLRKNKEKGKVDSKGLNRVVNALCKNKYSPNMTEEERKKFRAEFKSHLISTNLEWFMDETEIKEEKEINNLNGEG